MFLLNTEMYSKYRYRMRGDVLMYFKGVVVVCGGEVEFILPSFPVNATSSF